MLLHSPKNDNIYFQIPNGGAELGTTEGWQNVQPFSGDPPGVAPRPLVVETGLSYKGLNCFRYSPGDSSHAFGARAIPVVPGEDYLVRVAYRADRPFLNSGWIVGVFERSIYPESGWVTSGLGAGSQLNSWRGLTSDGGCSIPIADRWHVSSYVYTPRPGIFWATPLTSAGRADNTANCWFEFLDPVSPVAIDRNPIVEFRGLPATVTGNTVIYVVQQDKGLSIDRVTVRVDTVAGTVTTAPVISVGSNLPNCDNVMAATAMTNTTTANRVYNFPIVGSIPVLPAGSAIYFRVSTPAVGATTLTYDVNIYGQLN